MKVELQRVVFCGVNTVLSTQEIQNRVPGLRVNFYHCPMHLSLPGWGRVLMTGEQVEELNDKIANTPGLVTTLDIHILEDGEEKTWSLSNLHLLSATPVEGYQFRTDGVDRESEYAMDSPSNCPGLWVIDFQDSRFYEKRQPYAGIFNTDSSAPSCGVGVSADWDTIIKDCSLLSDYASSLMKAYNTLYQTPRNLLFSSCPKSCALDIAAQICGGNWVYDPFDDNSKYLYKCTEMDILNVLRDNLDRRVFGGVSHSYNAICPHEFRTADPFSACYDWETSDRHTAQSLLPASGYSLRFHNNDNGSLVGTKFLTGLVKHGTPTQGIAVDMNRVQAEVEACRTGLGTFRVGIIGLTGHTGDPSDLIEPGLTSAHFSWSGNLPITILQRDMVSPLGSVRRAYTDGIDQGGFTVLAQYVGEALVVGPTHSGWPLGGTMQSSGFPAIIQSAGPNGEEPSAKWWVREVEVDSSGAMAYRTGGRWVKAINISEYYLPESHRYLWRNNGGYDRPVYVFQHAEVYLFSEYPLGIHVDWVFRNISCKDETTGCPAGEWDLALCGVSPSGDSSLGDCP